MYEKEVVIVGETPSLGRAIADLLESDHVDCSYVAGVAELGGPRPDTFPAETRRRIIIAASNTRTSPTARAWIRGELPASELIVVGSRDPLIVAAPGIHLLRLPLPRNLFLSYLRALLDLPPDRGMPDPVRVPLLAAG